MTGSSPQAATAPADPPAATGDPSLPVTAGFDSEALGERLIRAAADLAALSGAGESYRETALVEGVRCTVMGLPQPWAARAVLTGAPGTEAVLAASAWLTDRAPRFCVMTRERFRAHPSLARLTDAEVMPAFVLAGAVPDVPAVPGVEVGPARTPAEFLTVYGAALAPIVTERDLADPAYVHLVARDMAAGGAPVGIARVSVTGDAACVSGVAVLPEHRGRGVGTLVSAAAARAAVAALPLGGGVVWLHATPASRPIYERLGFRYVDTHVQLSS